MQWGVSGATAVSDSMYRGQLCIGEVPVALRDALARATEGLIERQRHEGHWSPERFPHVLATSLCAAALHATGSDLHTETISRAREWLVLAQAVGGGWGDAPGCPANARATLLATAVLALTTLEETTSAEDRAVETGHEWLHAWFNADVAPPDAGRGALEPAYTLAQLAGILDASIAVTPRTARREVVRLSTGGWTGVAEHPGLIVLRSSFTQASRLLAGARTRATERAVSRLGEEIHADLTSLTSPLRLSLSVMGAVAAGRKDLAWVADAVQCLREWQQPDGAWPLIFGQDSGATAAAVRALVESGAHGPRIDQAVSQIRASVMAAPQPPLARSILARRATERRHFDACTASALSELLLVLCAHGTPRTDPTMRHLAARLAGAQTSNGAWLVRGQDWNPRFVRECPYTTARALRALAASAYLDEHPTVLREGLAYLRGAQRYDGTFSAAGYRDATMGTAEVVALFSDLGQVYPPAASRAIAALVRLQNEDGGWGGVRFDRSTALETGCAVDALVRLPVMPQAAAAASSGVDWLLDHQREDGLWDGAATELHDGTVWHGGETAAAVAALGALNAASRRFTDEYAE